MNLYCVGTGTVEAADTDPGGPGTGTHSLTGNHSIINIQGGPYITANLSASDDVNIKHMLKQMQYRFAKRSVYNVHFKQ